MKDSKKLKLLYLRDLLLRKSNEENKLSVQDIIKHMESLGIAVERKTVYDDMGCLEEYGMDIITAKGKENRYYIGVRDFELAELKLLVDAVATSRFIPEKKSKELIAKIGKLTNEIDEKKLKRQIIVASRPKTTNTSIYYNIDKLHEAIENKRQVTFKYFDIDTNWKKKYHKKERTVDPYALTWGNETYYLIGYHHEDHKIKNFRIDKMEAVEILEQKATKKEKDFDIVTYSKSVFSMFGAEDTTTVELEFAEGLVGVVRDKFGNDVRIEKQVETLTPDGEPTFRTRVDVALSPTFYGWMLYFGSRAKILGPKEAVEGYIGKMEESLENMRRREE
ncbi:MAG: helix-turn-helix transcriptional regulator [Filifactoraceae bacterium]